MDYQHYGILCPSGCGCEVMIDAIIDQTVTAKDIKILLDYDFQENAETDLVALLFLHQFPQVGELGDGLGDGRAG